MKETFGALLINLRERANLSNSELSELAQVPRSLISGLEGGQRRIGEYQAGKIAQALKLSGEELDKFVFAAIDTCAQKVLRDSRNYPARLLNIPARQLRNSNIYPEQISDLFLEEDQTSTKLYLTLSNGKKAEINTTLSLIT